METKSIVQTSANVIRITNLKRGDVYKRFDDNSYSSNVRFGIVQGIYNDGNQTFIEAVEYKKSYSEITAEIFIIRGDKDVAIFPASSNELGDEFSSCISSLQKKIEDKKNEIVSLQKTLESTEKLVSGELQQQLQTPMFREYTQADFMAKKLELEAQTKL